MNISGRLVLIRERRESSSGCQRVVQLPSKIGTQESLTTSSQFYCLTLLMYHNFIQGCRKGGPGPPNGSRGEGPKGHMSAQSHQGSETEMREFFGGTEGKNCIPEERSLICS